MSTDAIPALVVTTWGPGTARPYSPGGIFFSLFADFFPKELERLRIFMQIAMHKNKVILYWPTQINWQKFEKIPGLLEIFTKRELIFFGKSYTIIT